jgi:hypothetical protein
MNLFLFFPRFSHSVLTIDRIGLEFLGTIKVKTKNWFLRLLGP